MNVGQVTSHYKAIAASLYKTIHCTICLVGAGRIFIFFPRRNCASAAEAESRPPFLQAKFLLFLQPLWNLLVHIFFMIYHVMCHILCLCSVQVVMSEFQYRQKTTPTPLTQTCQISTQVCQNFMKIIHTLHQVTISTQIIFCEDLPSCSHVWAVGILMNKHQSKMRWYLATHVSTSSSQKNPNCPHKMDDLFTEDYFC